MITKQMLEIAAICVVAALLVIFASIYFAGTKKRKKLNNSIKNSGNNYNKDFDELVEQLRIIHAQLDLMFELSSVFIVCYDYGRNFFYISENGKFQLGYSQFVSEDSSESEQKKFEDLIHEDYISLYEEVTNFEDIRKHKIADSPYVMKIKNAVTHIYDEYIMRVKPIYDEDGINKALVAAFINPDYIKHK